MKELLYLNKYFLKYKWHLLLGIIFVIASALFNVMPAQLVRKSFNLITEQLKEYYKLKGTDKEIYFLETFDYHILKYSLLILGMALIKGIFLFFKRQTLIVMSRLIENDLKNEIYQHYQTLSFSFYKQNNTGDLMNRISEDVSKVRMYIGPAIMYGLDLVAIFVIVITCMLTVSVKLTVCVLAPLPILSLMIYLVSSTMEKRSTLIQKSLSALSTFTQEAFSGIRVIKAYVRENDSHQKMIFESENYREQTLSLTRVQAFFQPLMLGMIGLSVILVVFVGGNEVIEGRLDVGVIAEFIMYVYLLTWPVTSLGWTTSLVQRAAASQKRINEFLRINSSLPNKPQIETEQINGEITFQNVSLTYSDSGINALKNVSFNIPAGSSLGVLGTTGSGKSTLANLITRMYDTSEGKILFDGKLIKDFDIRVIRKNIGYVPQDGFLFSDTIRNNIAFGRDEISESELVRVATLADLHQNVLNFPDGYDTILGERGITLSGGQKQRVSIARAIAVEPTVLLLDDCLSAVDTKTENTILNNLKQVMINRTSVIISHRVSSVKLCENIIVLHEGEIVEQGSHEQLMQKQGEYFNLYQKQSEGSIE
ncbi:MAG: hypothetical protein RLZZ175_147 [Bacteroidota bacterium]|jgi:ATP-binding cassette subfamily B protein